MENDGTGILHLFQSVLGPKNLLKNVKMRKTKKIKQIHIYIYIYIYIYGAPLKGSAAWPQALN